MSANPPLRILHLIQSRRFAGSERLMLTLAGEQRRLGHQVDIAIKPGGPLDEVVAADGWQPIDVALGRPWSAWRLQRWVRRHSVDIVHGHLSQAVRLVVGCQSRSAAIAIGHAHVYKPGRAYSQLARQGGLITISGDIQRYYADLAGVAPAALPLVENGVDRRFQPGAVSEKQIQQLRQQLGVAPGQQLVTLTGRLAEQKGADVLIEACAQLSGEGLKPALRLFGAGQRGSAWARVLTTRIETLGLGEQIRLAGFADDVPALMAASDLHVVPSRYEPFGLTAIEAMAMGTPVVASRVGGLAEVVSDGIDGSLVPAGDADALARALADLLADDEKRHRLGAAAAQTVQRRFSAAAMAASVEAVYRRRLADLTA